MENLFAPNNMMKCLEQTVPSMTVINEEYKEIENENNKHSEDKLLQGILKAQVSFIKGMETIEEKQAKEKTQEQETKQQEVAIVPERRSSNPSNYKQSNSRKI